MMRVRVVWYAAGGGFTRMGPFITQVEAWAALRLTEKEQARQQSIHAQDARVWPEEQRSTYYKEAGSR
ncbi:hypothetical protein Rctr197k_227 [Virus Rctr197k]|nr:hypothetical protein Rctr197k_227 [Virus Rctr197k]